MIELMKTIDTLGRDLEDISFQNLVLSARRFFVANSYQKFHKPIAQFFFRKWVPIQADKQAAIDKLSENAQIRTWDTILERFPRRYDLAKFSVEIGRIGTQIGDFNSRPFRSDELLLVLTKGADFARRSPSSSTSKFSEMCVHDRTARIEMQACFLNNYNGLGGSRIVFEGFVAVIDEDTSKMARKMKAYRTAIILVQ